MMRYQKIKEGIFLERPNRFIAKVEIDGAIETVHVKNTGRCKVFTVFSDRFLCFLARKAISFHKRIDKRRADKGRKSVRILHVDAEMLQRVGHGIGNALPRIGQGAVQIKEKILIAFHGHLTCGARAERP